MDRSPKALIFNGMTILASLFLFLTGPLFVFQNLTMLLVQIFGIMLILWALIARRVNKQHKQHLPKGSFFLDKGPYEIIRHPIYAGFILIMSSLVQYDFTLLRVWAFMILLSALIMKIIREETTMEEALKGEYKAYKEKTKRIIPYVF